MEFNQLTKIFKTKTRALEILATLKDLKQVTRQGYYPQELPRIKEFCQKNKLFCIKSRFKVKILDKKENFSDYGQIIDENQKGLYYLYISKDEKLAHLAQLYELQQKHQLLGQLFNYPHCCINFFLQNKNKPYKKLIHKPTNQWTDLTDRNNALIFHFPCSSQCEKSITKAKQHHNLIN